MNLLRADETAAPMAFFYAADPLQSLKMAGFLLISSFNDKLDMVMAVHSNVYIVRINDVIRFVL